jgi:hypothetical protein
MQQEENKTVDIDTSGPGAEIELENDSKETENELEVKNDTTTEDSVESSDSPEKSEEQSTVQADKQEEVKQEEPKDELKEYSESVQKRIAKLTKKWREAERQKEEALYFAKTQLKAKEQAENKISKYEPEFFKNAEDSITSGLQAAQAKLAAAREANDLTAESEALTTISELGYRRAKLQETKVAQEDYNQQKQARQPDINLARQQIQVERTPDPKAESWAEKNTWFGQDAAMTYTAFDLHKKLTEQEGFDPSSDEYYSEIDKRIRLEFPHKFATNEVKETAKPVQTVASAKRSTKTGRRTVRLTPSQVAIAKKLGVPLEEYAKQLNITKEV